MEWTPVKFEDIRHWLTHYPETEVKNAARSWNTMMYVCYHPPVKNYKYYGGIGIKVDPDWHDFDNFFADMGPRPVMARLARIDVGGDYTFRNCGYRLHHESWNDFLVRHQTLRHTYHQRHYRTNA